MVGGNVQPLWQSGGAVDLSGSSDPHAVELERRIVLSQYLTAINGAGSMPPQETGLVCNSWHGKFHLEMHWWHAAHFALWGRPHLLKRSLPWYQRILPMAQATARNRLTPPLKHHLILVSDTAHYWFTLTFRGANFWHGTLMQH